MTNTARAPRRPRRAPMKDPTTRMRLAQVLFARGKKSPALRRDGRPGLERLAEARPTDEAARARRPDELAVFHEDVAAEQHVLGGAHHFGALVEAVVALRVVRGGRDRLPALGVEDDEVGVGADRDRSLARIKAEQLRRLRREEID